MVKETLRALAHRILAYTDPVEQNPDPLLTAVEKQCKVVGDPGFRNPRKMFDIFVGVQRELGLEPVDTKEELTQLLRMWQEHGARYKANE